MKVVSPYDGIHIRHWTARTEELLADYPLDRKELVEVVLQEWKSIFGSRVGKQGLRIGEHIFPRPQVMGYFLHELIPYDLQNRYPANWRRDITGDDKDLVYLPNSYWSTEIKTSSDKVQIYGNRSYAQPRLTSKKSKSGFYLTVNFEKWSDVKGTSQLPAVRLIRMGWLDHVDWVSQKASSGQRADLRPEVYQGKLIVLYQKNG